VKRSKSIAGSEAAESRPAADGWPSGIASEWFWETDAQHRFSFVSSQTALATGLNPSDILGRRREDFAADRGDPKWLRHLEDLEEHRPFWRFEYPIRLPSGSLVHLSVSGEPKFDDNGEFLGYRGAASDITERRKIEQELRDARELFQAVLDHAPFGIVLKDSAGRYLEVSHEWQRRFGLTRDQVIGKTPGDILPPTLAKAYEARDAAVLKQGGKVVREERLEQSDGEDEYFLTTRFSTLDRDGNITGLGLISADITDRKLAELAHAGSEQQLRAIADNLPVLIARHDRQWRYRFINREGANWYGMTASQIVGRAIPDILSKETCDDIRPIIDRVLSGEPAHYSGTIDYPDGKTRDVSINYVPDRAADGSVQGWFALAQDMTEQEKATQALRESETRLQAIMKYAPAGVYLKDHDGRFLIANPEYAGWFGQDIEEIVGKTSREIFPDSASTRYVAHDQAVIDKRKFISMEDEVRHPDGTVRTILINKFPVLSDEGAVIAVGGVDLDITEFKKVEQALRESEAQMRTIADNLPAFIANLDSEMRFRFVNRTVEEWYGLGNAEIIGRRVQDIVFPETYERLLPRMQAVLSGQAVNFEDNLQYPDGRRRAVEGAWIPEFDKSGQVHGWFALIHDISERKRLEAELVRRERFATMGQLTGTVAHELRNPLGAVAASVMALRRKTGSAGLDVERSLSRAERGIGRCERIITELLDFARAKGLQRESTHFCDWLATVIAEQEIPPGIILSTGFCARDKEISIDREDIRRAIINVLDNACQALVSQQGPCGPAEGRIDIGCRDVGDRLVCEIRDNGTGIPSDSLGRVLEPLFSTKSFGTGLGLPTVQRIMEEHGGGIEITSELGKGTVVRLSLPLEVDRAEGGNDDEP